MKRCTILCEVRLMDDDTLPYKVHHHLTIGPFSDHDQASKFMMDYLEEGDLFKKVFQDRFRMKIDRMVGGEIVDITSPDEILSLASGLEKSLKDHELALRVSHRTISRGL